MMDNEDDPIRDVERIEHALDEHIEKLKQAEADEHRPPGDRDLAKVFPVDPPKAGPRAPNLGS